jgi:hypothetical protein
MSPTTTTLRQHEIPGQPQSVVVRHYSLAAVAEMEVDFRAALPQGDSCVVGASIELASVGSCDIQTLALALRDQVFCLSLQQRPSQAQRRVLQKFFSNIGYLAGFELSHTLVLLVHTLGSDISGYDLSTVAIRAKTRDLTTPGGFLNSMNPSVSARDVDERWDGGIRRGDPDSTGTPEPNIGLRAWFTAMYVTHQHSALCCCLISASRAADMALPDLRGGQQLSTKFIDKPVRICRTYHHGASSSPFAPADDPMFR